MRRAATIELDWDTRQKSRFDAVDSQGRRIGVFLPRGRIVRGGDVLVAEDGSLIAVEAQAQPVLVVTPCAHGSPLDLLRAAYHLGNRHVPLEVSADRLQLEPDHVLAEMLRRMGLSVATTRGPSSPRPAPTTPPGRRAGHPRHAGHGLTRHDHGPTATHGHDHGHDAVRPWPRTRPRSDRAPHGHEPRGRRHSRAHAGPWPAPSAPPRRSRPRRCCS